MNKFVGWALVVSAIIGLIGTVFNYDPQFQNAMYTLAGFGLYIFGIWGAVLLLKK